MQKILSYLFGALLLISAVGHIVNPEFYAPLIPDFIPEVLANVGTAILEAIAGILLFIPKYRHWGGLGFFLLMVGFLPLHIWELFKDNPVVGPSPGPEIRVAIQLLLIYGGWWIYKDAKP